MESLVVFAKRPLAGRVKTRLSSGRGDAQAALLYGAFLQDTARACLKWREQSVAVDPNRRLVWMLEPDGEDPVIVELARRCGARVTPQGDGDLGDRLARAFKAEFDRGARAVCAIGTDSPTLPPHLVDHAFRALMFERVVLGPTFDGGYWLVGAQRPPPDLFTDIPWSTPDVLQTTLDHLRSQDVDGYLLPFWYDVDEEADLDRLLWHIRALRAHDPTAATATWSALRQMGLADGVIT
jgi:rSAM/selenodomain-associated transferase 1